MAVLTDHRVTYIANDEETPCAEDDCDDVALYMCGDCGQHACDFHFNELNEQPCTDREKIHGLAVCGPCYQNHLGGEPCKALSDSENDCQCQCDSGMEDIEGKTPAQINAVRQQMFPGR